MGKFANKAPVPSGMLAPTGYAQTRVDPVVQSTTRPAGSLLQSSPGYDTIRDGKNRFQGKGPTGGFRPFTFAEDIGGSGAALSVIPGDTEAIRATEWLPESEDSLPEGSLIIADRGSVKHHAMRLHEGMHTVPDMGDRHPDRPLSRALINPASLFRQEYRENPIVAVVASAGVVVLAWIIGNDLEREFRSRRGRGVAAAGAGAAAATTADETRTATSNTAGSADDVLNAVKKVADDAVDAIREAGKAVAEIPEKAADAVT